MTDTLFADVSSYQIPVTDAYPYHFLSFRSNDGTYRDTDFAANLAWAKHATDTGKLSGFLVYFVYEPNWQQTVATFKAMVGAPHRRMAVMIDMEGWNGKLSGNQSAGANAAREDIIKWLAGHMSLASRLLRRQRKRVIAYANAGDYASMWPTRGDARTVLANYSGNPAFPGKIAHQFSSTFNVPPFGPCDINSADGLTPAEFAAALGLTDPKLPSIHLPGRLSVSDVSDLKKAVANCERLLDIVINGRSEADNAKVPGDQHVDGLAQLSAKVAAVEAHLAATTTPPAVS